MIPFASQRANGCDLATHLQNEHDNEQVSVFDVRGSIATDLHGAFAEWEAQAHHLTRCEKYLYSLSINPDPKQGALSRDQYLDYIGRAEAALGLAEQPRAIVFHTKHEREHCHVVWSRIDVENEKAVHLAFDREKLMRVTREFAKDHQLSLPAGYAKGSDNAQKSLYELEKERLSGISAEEHTKTVSALWKGSDNALAFVGGLSDKGYLLATGKRTYVLVDLYGGQHALPRLIDDKAVKTKDVVKFLENEYPKESLPSVDEAKAMVTAYRKLIEKDLKQAQHEQRVQELTEKHQRRRLELSAQQQSLDTRLALEREAMLASHRSERDQQRQSFLAVKQDQKEHRESNKPGGWLAQLGKYSGYDYVTSHVHRYQDRQRLKDYQHQRQLLRQSQEGLEGEAEAKAELERFEMNRRIEADRKVAQRELTSLQKQSLKEERVKARESGEQQPTAQDIIDHFNKTKVATGNDRVISNNGPIERDIGDNDHGRAI